MFWVNLVSSFINIAAIVFGLITISGHKFNYKNKLGYFGFIVIVLLGAVLASFAHDSVRASVIMSSVCFLSIIIYKNTSEGLIAFVQVFVTVLIAETLMSITVLNILQLDLVFITEQLFGSFLLNLIISVLIIVICKMKFSRSVFNLLKGYTEKLDTSTIILAVTNVGIILFIYQMTSFFEVNAHILFVINIILSLIYMVIIYRGLKHKGLMFKYKDENQNLISNLNDYEVVIEQQRMLSHENQNQLLIIKEMVKNRELGTIKYIEEVLKDNETDDVRLLEQAKRIPAGGLRGIIYQKMLKMKNLGIKADLIISRNVKKDILSKISAKDNYDICRIIGVFLDNALEESLKTKEKEIAISLYMTDEINIEISNYCKDIPDLEVLGKIKQSSKDKNRGHGLKLVADILEGNSNLINERRVKDTIFSQVLKINDKLLKK